MISINDFSIDEETINMLGLQQADKPVNAQNAPNTRVFKYPHLKDVFVMESDLYGNKMPENSCFLAFYGTHGFKGRQLLIDTLRNSTVEDIKKIVENNVEG